MALAIRFLSKELEKFYSCTSSTIYIQNYGKEDENNPDKINHVYVHLIPRRKGDLKRNDDIYPLLQDYDRQLQVQYNNNIVLLSPHSQVSIEKLGLEAQKHREYLKKAEIDYS
eukprot:TRINITY_DN1914_c0_g1_i3.p2 TRINITY_DN1914_c0_g1~~TRINITY_DN1914_c0_g1_i3.p2  ORF type:complete len:113 (-),score=27.30 TRINITY_DN1914_c0_g1_i3:98-436(-)